MTKALIDENGVIKSFIAIADHDMEDLRSQETDLILQLENLETKGQEFSNNLSTLQDNTQTAATALDDLRAQHNDLQTEIKNAPSADERKKLITKRFVLEGNINTASDNLNELLNQAEEILSQIKNTDKEKTQRFTELRAVRKGIFTPPEGLTIAEVPDTSSPGDTFVNGKLKKVPVVKIYGPLTARQLKLTLNEHDLLDAAESAIAAIPDAKQRRAARIEWESSQQFERHNPTLLAIASALKLSEDKINELWNEAIIV